MTKKFQFRISADGTVRAETIGIKGPACTSFISMFERITDSQAIDSEYTAEYHQQTVENQAAQTKRQEDRNTYGQ